MIMMMMTMKTTMRKRGKKMFMFVKITMVISLEMIN